MNDLVVKDNVKIEDMIYEVRGKQVIFDKDLAKLYQVETRVINQTVKRNIERFPEEFCFRLTREELYEVYSRSQFVILNDKQGRGSNTKYLPYVFTEQGVAMLSAMLKSDIAITTSIKIINAFVAMRKYISNNLLEHNYIKDMVIRHDEEIKLLQRTFSKFDSISNELFFEGQIYDAYSLLLDIFNGSNKSIVIIDNYISKELLDVVCKTNKKINVYTKNIDNNLINKYIKQYNNLDININNSFHDRFIIVDDKELYHSGASFKDLGKKCFAINRIDNIDMINDIRSKL